MNDNLNIKDLRHLLVEKLSTGAGIIKDGHFIYVNPALAKIFGRSKEELLAIPTVLELVFEEDKKTVEEKLNLHEEGETRQPNFEFRIKGKEKGDPNRFIESWSVAFIDSNGDRLIGVSTTDITDRKIAESRMRELIAEIETLRGILPTCMHCHKIRDKHKKWLTPREYLLKLTKAKLSHGLCPECEKEHYSEFLETDS